MNKPILTGNIGAIPVLRSMQNQMGIGGVTFMYPEDDGGNTIGGGQGGQNGQQQQQQGDPNGQQQQQQPQSALDTIDLDLLDDNTRAAVERARAELTTAMQQAHQARDYQSRYDRLVAEQQRSQQQQQQQVQREDQKQPTFEEELEATYIAEGIPPAQAKAHAKLNAKIFGKFSDRVTGFVDGRVAPVAGSVAMNNASLMFQDALQQSQRLQDPDVAQRVWEAVEATVRQGGQVSNDMIENLSKIYHVDISEARGHNGGNRGTPMFQPQHQQQQQIIQNGSTRHTFPGAGHLAVRTQPQRPTGSDLDPETAAAVAATKVAMGNSFSWANNSKGKVSRGGLTITRQ